MPRPLRMEYENAYYHVMNRGRGRQQIFPGEPYYQAFLTSLSEAHQRFGLEIQVALVRPGNTPGMLDISKVWIQGKVVKENQ
ncbi:MAG: hypothetical protein IIB73_12785 [Proteobacteria bacterium]|nr:hypothetical protein [Pseudomonadota bacterium]